jgi:hypothetical protein
LNETWTKDFGLYLVTKSIDGEEFDIETRNLLTLDLKVQIEIKSNSLYFD